MPNFSVPALLRALLVWPLIVLAEGALGRAMGLGWDRILSDYDLLHGGLMPLGLLAMALTPWAVRRMQASRDRRLGRREAAP